MDYLAKLTVSVDDFAPAIDNVEDHKLNSSAEDTTPLTNESGEVVSVEEHNPAENQKAPQSGLKEFQENRKQVDVVSGMRVDLPESVPRGKHSDGFLKV